MNEEIDITFDDLDLGVTPTLYDINKSFDIIKTNK